MAAIDEMLRQMVDQGASDLHLSTGKVPTTRIFGELVPLEQGREPLGGEEIKELLYGIVSEQRRQIIENELDLDFAYHIQGLSRFRVNYFFQHAGLSAVFRRIPEKIQTIDELKLPEVLKKLSLLRRGLVLVTGPTGSGKSTTLAAMISLINDTRQGHILTIEDPVEFVHPVRKCRITQREVHNDTKSFAAALREAGRMDPDVVLVGEMRDLETISLTLTLAEMGSLVFATLHTNSAAKTIDRIINVFPQEERGKARVILSEVLSGIVSQQLMRKRDGSGRVAAIEVMTYAPPLPSLIRTGKTGSLISLIEISSNLGMQSMDNSLEKMVRAGEVDGLQAYMRSVDKKRFETHLKGSSNFF